MKKIQLSQNKLALVDDEDYEWLNGYKWYAQKGRNTFYVARDQGWGKTKKHIYMHREILNTPIGIKTDHRNGNGLHNFRNNLRVCTNQQNHFNQMPKQGYTSKYKGVSWVKRDSKWRASIRINKKNKNLGLFDSEIEAAKAYDQVALETRGQFARINFNQAACVA